MKSGDRSSCVAEPETFDTHVRPNMKACSSSSSMISGIANRGSDTAASIALAFSLSLRRLG